MKTPTRLPAVLIVGLLSATGCALDEGDIDDDDAIDQPELDTAESIGSADDKCWVKAASSIVWPSRDVRAFAVAYCQTGYAASFTIDLQYKEPNKAWKSMTTQEWDYRRSDSGKTKYFRDDVIFHPAVHNCYRTKVKAFGQSETGPVACF